MWQSLNSIELLINNNGCKISQKNDYSKNCVKVFSIMDRFASVYEREIQNLISSLIMVKEIFNTIFCLISKLFTVVKIILELNIT